MRRGPVIAEIAAWTLFFPVAFVLMGARLLGHGRRTREERIEALLAWYPDDWRERHGDELAQLLRDAIDGGRDGVGMSLDVAREGLAERLRDFRWAQLRSAFLMGLGWTMVIPQGIVAAVLSFTAVPPSWFLALHVGPDERWLVVGGMIGVGLLLVERGMRIADVHCSPRRQSAG